MRSAVLLSVASAIVVTTSATDAPDVTGNPSNIGYSAIIPSSAPISGEILIFAPETGNGATVQVNLQNLPTTSGPFAYHIHALPVNSTGSCESTGGHLDPYTGTTPCNSSMPAACQVGDLSGKHGTVPYSSLVTNYGDAYLSLVADTPAFIGNRSFVVHDASGARIACANFVFHNGGGYSGPGSGAGSAAPTGSVGGGNSTGGAAPSKTGAVPSFTPTGAASVMGGAVGGVFGMVAAVGAALL